MSQWAQFRVGQLKDLLKSKGMKKDELTELKGKSDVVFAVVEAGITLEEALEFCSGQDNKDYEGDYSDALLDALNTVEEADNEVYKEEKKKIHEADEKSCGDSSQNTVRYMSAEWVDCVMSQFRDDELVEGNPTLAGLRRVSELMLGEIVFSGPIQLNTNFPENPMEPSRANCMYEVVIAFKADIEPWVDLSQYKYPHRTFRGAGGSFAGNTDDLFVMYPEAIAENRAETRALRKALGLKNVGAEEVMKKSHEPVLDAIKNKNKSLKTEEFVGEYNEDDFISSPQINFIKSKCDALGVDYVKFINKNFHTGKDTEPKYSKIEEVTKGIASEMIKELNKYQSLGDGSKGPPKEILLGVAESDEQENIDNESESVE